MKFSPASVVMVITGLALAALGALTFSAYQASPGQAYFEHAKAAASAQGHNEDATPSPTPRHSAKPHPRHSATPLPRDSGTGRRVVYSLGKQRVWLVRPTNGRERVAATFRVAPSSVSPTPGTFAVTSRTAKVTGSDGVPIEHVVRFADVKGVTVGFSAALDGSSPEASSQKATGGIREKRQDGRTMWKFGRVGTPVVVVR